MITAAIVLAYVVVMVPVWRRAGYAVAWEGGVRPVGTDIALALVLGFVVAAFWPLVLPGYVAWQFSRDGGGFLKPPKVRKTQAERIAELEACNAELERELGISDEPRVRRHVYLRDQRHASRQR